ncbi:MAG: sigma-70 family RNA polymerase sigma factor [Deltaproteobacteria bacterium]|nr:sigma-70 family RNA polymerase sigma factor [Deltaproteobacteria bacterium]
MSQNSDRDIVDSVLERYGFQVHRRCVRILAREDLASAAAREALVGFLRKRTAEMGPAMAALYQATSAACLKRLSGGAGQRSEWLRGIRQLGDEAAQIDARRDALASLLVDLERDDQEVLVCHHLDRMTAESIADLTRIPIESVRRRLAIFAERVGAELPEDEDNPFAFDPQASPEGPSELELDRILAGEASSPEGEEIRSRIQSLEAERDRMRSDAWLAEESKALRELLGRTPPSGFWERMRRKTIWAPAIAAALAVGLVFLAMWAEPGPAAGKNLAWRLDVFRVQGVEWKELLDGTVFRPDDRLVFKVDCKEPRIVFLGVLPETGEARVPSRAGPVSWPVVAGSAIPLPVYMDGRDIKEDRLRFFAFFCTETPEPNEMLGLMEQAYPLSSRGTRDLSVARLQETEQCLILSRLVHKEPGNRPGASPAE